MLRWRRLPLLLALLVLTCMGTARICPARIEVEAPDDPLRSTLGLSTGFHYLDDQDYKHFFGEERIQAWTLRYDYRVWRFVRLGMAVTASNKNRLETEISIGEDNYPIRYTFTSFQSMGEIYLRSYLPRILWLEPHLSFGALLSRVHAESSGYVGGYDAVWEEYRPAPDVIQYSGGWRAALGTQLHAWANIFLMVEGSRVKLDAYNQPRDTDPPVGEWDHSGWRLDVGLIQRF